MKVALVLHGEPPNQDELKLLDACQSVVCADGAAEYLLKAQRPPTVIVGDLDSLSPEGFKWAQAVDVPIERHPQEKDETDGELALQKAFDLGATSLLVLGGHGGRSAMFLCNLKLLRRANDRGMEAIMVGRGESLRYVTAGGELNLAGRTGATLNVVPIDGDAVVTLSGTQWEASEIRLDARSARGLSNKITSDGAKVRVHKGTVLTVVERKKKEYYVL
ncbi:MAG: thiamine diphosphokinase [Thermoplasmatota archaeon]